MPDVTASVGKVGAKQCYNLPGDQQLVQDLLNRIGTSDGGADGALSDPIVPRVISKSLYDAILTFQRHNSARYGLSVDGHVDPHDKTIRLLNALAAPRRLPPLPPPGPTPTPLPPCGPMKVVLRRHLTSTLKSSLVGGIQGEFALTNLLPASAGVEINVTGLPSATVSVSGFSTRRHLFLFPAPASGPSIHSWDFELKVSSGPSLPGLGTMALVDVAFLTNWSPGDPLCT